MSASVCVVELTWKYFKFCAFLVTVWITQLFWIFLMDRTMSEVAPALKFKELCDSGPRECLETKLKYT